VRLTEFLQRGHSDNISESTEKILERMSFSLSTVPGSEVPISVSSSAWETLGDPERLSRRYVFSRFDHLVYFINESLKYQEESHHHAKMTIEGLEVTVETHTHDIQSVTSQDLMLAKYFDEIYSDVSFLDPDTRL